MHPRIVLGALLVALLVSPADGSGSDLEARVRLGEGSPQIEGRVRMIAEGGTLRLRLPANRFASPPGWNDLERHFLLAGPSWEPGGTRIHSLTIDGRGQGLR